MPAVTLEGLGQDGRWGPKWRRVARGWKEWLRPTAEPIRAPIPPGWRSVQTSPAPWERPEVVQAKVAELRRRWSCALSDRGDTEISRIAEELSGYAKKAPPGIARQQAWEEWLRVMRVANLLGKKGKQEEEVARLLRDGLSWYCSSNEPKMEEAAAKLSLYARHAPRANLRLQAAQSATEIRRLAGSLGRSVVRR